MFFDKMAGYSRMEILQNQYVSFLECLYLFTFSTRVEFACHIEKNVQQFITLTVVLVVKSS